MLGLSTLLDWLTGSALKALTLPALILGLMVAGHQYVRARDVSLEAKATARCDARWEVEIMEQRASYAEADAAAARAERDAADVVTSEMRRRLNDVQGELEKHRATLAGADQRCLSDGVRDLVRGGEAEGGAGRRR